MRKIFSDVNEEEEFYIVCDSETLFTRYLNLDYDISYNLHKNFDESVENISNVFISCLFSQYDPKNIIRLEAYLNEYIRLIKSNNIDLIESHKLIYNYINRINIRINKLKKIV